MRLGDKSRKKCRQAVKRNIVRQLGVNRMQSITLCVAIAMLTVTREHYSLQLQRLVLAGDNKCLCSQFIVQY